MSIEAPGLDISNFTDWLESQEARELQGLLEEKIARYLFRQDSEALEPIVTRLAWLGARAENRALLAKEIVELKISLQGEVEPCGWKLSKAAHKAGKFIYEHKLEIAAGLAIAATGIGIAYLTGYALSLEVCGVVVAGTGSVLSSLENNHPLQIPKIASRPWTKEEREAHLQSLTASSMPPPPPSGFLITSEGIWVDGRFYSNQLLEHSHRLQASSQTEFVQQFLAGESSLPSSLPSPNHLFHDTPADLPPIDNTPSFLKPDSQNIVVSAPSSPPTSLPLPSPQLASPLPSKPLAPIKTPYEQVPGVISRKFTLPGTQNSYGYIGWINGINNTFEESQASSRYIQDLAGGHTISGIYNCSHTALVDLIESALLNHHGYSPIVGQLLQDEWRAFHEANIDRPNAKLLQVCHSQGTIHVRNTLENSPPEIRDRIIVVAIAPGAVVPEQLCFKSFNYASKRDIVYKFEPTPQTIESITVDDVILPRLGPVLDHREELILLEPHPEATGIDHGIQSPTFEPILEQVFANYERHKGEYLPSEKGREN